MWQRASFIVYCGFVVWALLQIELFAVLESSVKSEEKSLWNISNLHDCWLNWSPKDFLVLEAPQKVDSPTPTGFSWIISLMN